MKSLDDSDFLRCRLIPDDLEGGLSFSEIGYGRRDVNTASLGIKVGQTFDVHITPPHEN